ncbi:Hypothetical predicted protein [Mytilus galloprovincialis]|uniref:Uncharacterized protein n=1 Tax=Mytilus galloprovincialis TaxID=29158 RepID=A0A8B6HT09_MYTGA|nr:Hypothetical predicted protein [Mytilus galloprovincialis]
MAIPSWPIYAAALGGMVCLIHDWMYLHIVTDVAMAPWLFTWCIGIKNTTMMFFLMALVVGFIVGVIQLLEVSNKGQLINGFALTSKLGVAAGWASLILLTSESFPTVVR